MTFSPGGLGVREVDRTRSIVANPPRESRRYQAGSGPGLKRARRIIAPSRTLQARFTYPWSGGELVLRDAGGLRRATSQQDDLLAGHDEEQADQGHGKRPGRPVLDLGRAAEVG